MRDTHKIFLPLTLDNSTKTMFSGKQLVGFCVFLLLGVAWQICVLRIGDSTNWPTWVLVVIDIVVSWFLIFLLRKLVLKENQLIKQYQQHQNLQKTDLGFIWNIFSVREGHIYYCNGMQAVIVQLTHGYLLDRPADQEQVHREAVKTALGNLTKQGYKFMYLNREVKDSNLEPLMKTEHNLYQYRDTSIYETASKIIRHTFDVCDRIANTEQEYYVIFADTMDTIKKLDHAAKGFLDNLHGGIYVKMQILNDDEIWEFIAQLYGISYINTAELLSQKFEDNQLPLVKIVDVIRDNDDRELSQVIEDTTLLPEPEPESEPEPIPQTHRLQGINPIDKVKGLAGFLNKKTQPPQDDNDEGDFL